MNAPGTRIRSKSSNSFEFTEKSLDESQKDFKQLSRTSATSHLTIQRRKANTAWESKPSMNLTSDMESSAETCTENSPKLEKKRSTFKSVMKKLLKNKSKETNHAMILLNECMRDNLKISLEHCENLMKSADLKDLQKARDAYTGQGLLHFC
mmetsp:Transcript_23417/g.23373  ORF Transcript_23417/g.23373 Transcript_23417/m.23373 type:complete len:152 (+) Transcript_23417:45-500(+)